MYEIKSIKLRSQIVLLILTFIVLFSRKPFIYKKTTLQKSLLQLRKKYMVLIMMTFET